MTEPQFDCFKRRDESEDYTQWVVIKDLTNKVFYFSSYNDLCLKKIDLGRVDFSLASNEIPIDMEEGYQDVTDALQKPSMGTCN